MRKSACLALSVAVLMAAVIGCRSGGRPATVRVEGTVTLDGQPLEGASVTFAAAEGGRPATGLTDASGKFSLKTFEPGDGAIPGMYNVSVSKIEATAGSSDPESEDLMGAEATEVKSLIPDKYFSPKTSGLTVEVKRGMDPVTLALTSQ